MTLLLSLHYCIRIAERKQTSVSHNPHVFALTHYIIAFSRSARNKKTALSSGKIDLMKLLISCGIDIRFQELPGRYLEFNVDLVPGPHLYPIDDLGQDHAFL